ncbi:MAG: hypothetical protein Fur0032_07530 [Terrimicrobiaceae bacterium]
MNPTSDQLNDLCRALRRRLAVVADHGLRDRDPAAHLSALREAAAHLETLEQALPVGTDPQLRHYLERQSYQKAIDWLEARQG